MMVDKEVVAKADAPLSSHITGDAAAASAAGMGVDRRELAFIAVERTRMPMVVADARAPDMPIVLANKAFLDQTGYTADEVIGVNCRFLQGPGTSRASVDRVREAVAAGEVLTIELLNYRKDGTPFWNQLHINPIFGDDGTLQYFFASQLDVTQQRKAQELEAAEYMLLREVDHRAKNALALVQGIVRLSRSDDAASYAEAIEGRVGALARAHGLLSERHWTTVSLRQLISAEIEAIGASRTTLSGDPVQLDADTVQPLALLMHELIGNAARHGALSAREGSITIRWRELDGNLVIELDEVGGPPPKQERMAGFGSTIADAIVRRQLRGSVAHDWRPVGLATCVSIPRQARTG